MLTALTHLTPWQWGTAIAATVAAQAANVLVQSLNLSQWKPRPAVLRAINGVLDVAIAAFLILLISQWLGVGR